MNQPVKRPVLSLRPCGQNLTRWMVRFSRKHKKPESCRCIPDGMRSSRCWLAVILLQPTGYLMCMYPIAISQLLRKEENNMKLTQSLGMLLLAIWLILTGLIAFVPALGGLGIILSVLAIIAGILILIGR